MLANPDVDVVSVCTPNAQHAADVVKIAEAGKHILIEKPPATDVEGLRAMRDAVRRAGVKTQVGFVLHWNPLFQAVQRVVADGLLGHVILAQLDYWHRLTADDQLPLYAWLVNKEQGGQHLPRRRLPPHRRRALVHRRRDRRSLSATRRTLRATTTTRRRRWACSTSATAPSPRSRPASKPTCPTSSTSTCWATRAPCATPASTAASSATARSGSTWAPPRPPAATVSDHPFQGEIDYFLDCIARGVDSKLNLEDGIKTTEACLAVDIAAADRQAREATITVTDA